MLAVAAEVIRRADREHPADAVLRHELMAQRRFAQYLKALVSRAVFAYFRWRGWLDPARPLPAQIKHALELAGAFAERPQTFSGEKLIARSVPSWIGAEMEVTAAWARALQAEPKLWLRARRGQGAALARKLGPCRIPCEPALSDAVEYLGNEDLFRTTEFHAGEFEIQDLSSQMVGLLCAPQPGQTWWDACAGEGGKTLHLSELMDNKGLIWASDRAAWRLQQLKRRAARAGCFNYRAAFWEGGARLPTRTKFDGVLVDAPCSGAGTWHRNPHARWTTTPEDVRELAAVQKQLLARVAPAVKPGGRLLYAVCTMTRAETAEVAEWFNREAAGFEPAPLPALGGVTAAAPTILMWPQERGGNGMFVAAWRRV